MLYIAELQELDRELNEWFRGPPSASSKHNTYMNKYFKFCAVTGVPVLPLSLITFCRYAKWLPENNINSGWPGVKSYIGALAQFNISMAAQILEQRTLRYGHCSELDSSRTHKSSAQRP